MLGQGEGTGLGLGHWRGHWDAWRGTESGGGSRQGPEKVREAPDGPEGRELGTRGRDWGAPRGAGGWGGARSRGGAGGGRRGPGQGRGPLAARCLSAARGRPRQTVGPHVALLPGGRARVRDATAHAAPRRAPLRPSPAAPPRRSRPMGPKLPSWSLPASPDVAQWGRAGRRDWRAGSRRRRPRQ